MKKLLVVLLVLFSVNAHAGFLLELGGTYMSDNLTTDETKTSAKYFYNIGLLFSLKKHIWGGWNYSGISHTDKDDTTIDFTASDTGPYVKWQFGRHELYSLSMAYNILSTATFANGTDREKWTGTSMWFQFGVMPEFKEGFHIGASLNYYLANYTKKTVDGTETSSSNSKSWIFPMLTLTKEW
ncbi:hypothetical protein ACNQKP_17925 [Bdellovibrio bacteriovorus]|uniref:hypothetical protein n=1 Tax=Bdellovibrio bacteriovorus TaxID=959 RepID=UPI003AA9C800